MVEQAGCRVLRAFLHQQRLIRADLETQGTAELFAVLGADGAAHVQAVQPHLVGIALLVPEASLGIAGEVDDVAHQGIQRLAVTLVPGALVQIVHQDAGHDVIHGAAVAVEDVAVRIDVFIHKALDVFVVLLLLANPVGLLHAGEEHARVIVELGLRREILGFKLAHDGIAGFHGIAEGATVFHTHGNHGSFFSWWLICQAKYPFRHWARDASIFPASSRLGAQTDRYTFSLGSVPEGRTTTEQLPASRYFSTSDLGRPSRPWL